MTFFIGHHFFVWYQKGAFPIIENHFVLLFHLNSLMAILSEEIQNFVLFIFFSFLFSTKNKV